MRVAVGPDESMPAEYFGRGPGVLMVADVYGPSPFYRHLSALLAEAGLGVLLPDFFFRQGDLVDRSKKGALERRARLDERRTLFDLETALAWLRERATGAGDRLGAIGFCMGGTFVLDLASSEAGLVSVCYYGFPVPQESLVAPPPRPIDLVDGLAGPVLGFWGEEDEAVGLENVRSYVKLAERFAPEFSATVLPRLGHGFLAEADLDDREDPAAATWATAVDHLRRHLVS